MKQDLVTVTMTREQWKVVSKALGLAVKQSEEVRGTQATPADSSMPGIETRKITLFLIPLRRVNSLLKRWLRRVSGSRD